MRHETFTTVGALISFALGGLLFFAISYFWIKHKNRERGLICDLQYMNTQTNNEKRDLEMEIFRLKCIMTKAGLETEKEKGGVTQ